MQQQNPAMKSAAAQQTLLNQFGNTQQQFTSPKVDDLKFGGV
jgi:hypothetical protein